MLNTDAYNPQVKKRMTKVDFIKNNRGINDGSDLPEEFLSEIFEDIANNEIRMKDEIEAGLSVVSTGPGFANAIASVGRDLQKEAYVMQSNGMANKTEVCVIGNTPFPSTDVLPGFIPNDDAFPTKGF
jgi:brefeldin A-inhibited guanine nucleotide-exchange protein